MEPNSKAALAMGLVSDGFSFQAEAAPWQVEAPGGRRGRWKREDCELVKHDKLFSDWKVQSHVHAHNLPLDTPWFFLWEGRPSYSHLHARNLCLCLSRTYSLWHHVSLFFKLPVELWIACSFQTGIWLRKSLNWLFFIVVWKSLSCYFP